jgi:hypothetical protein
MTTKQYLGQINRLDKMIQNKLAEIYQLKSMACSVSVSSDCDRVQSSHEMDRLGSTVAKIVDLEQETDKLVDDFLAKRKHIVGQIDEIKNSDYYQILSLRYVHSETFEGIANKTHWSIRKVFSLHGEALLEFERLYGRQYL